jgi:hypothetical protein
VFFIEGRTVWIRTRWIELTKIPAESDELGIRERLPMEDDDKSLTPSGFNGVDVGPRQWLGQIDVGNFSAQCSVQIFDCYGHLLFLAIATRPYDGFPPTDGHAEAPRIERQR